MNTLHTMPVRLGCTFRFVFPEPTEPPFVDDFVAVLREADRAFEFVGDFLAKCESFVGVRTVSEIGHPAGMTAGIAEHVKKPYEKAQVWQTTCLSCGAGACVVKNA
jgi:hypothetical protein